MINLPDGRVYGGVMAAFLRRDKFKVGDRVLYPDGTAPSHYRTGTVLYVYSNDTACIVNRDGVDAPGKGRNFLFSELLEGLPVRGDEEFRAKFQALVDKYVEPLRDPFFFQQQQLKNQQEQNKMNATTQQTTKTRPPADTDATLTATIQAIKKLAETQETLTADDIISAMGTNAPTNPSTLGAVLREMANCGFIEQTGVTQRSKRTRGPIMVWKSKKYDGTWQTKMYRGQADTAAVNFVSSVGRDLLPFLVEAVERRIADRLAGKL